MREKVMKVLLCAVVLVLGFAGIAGAADCKKAIIFDNPAANDFNIKNGTGELSIINGTEPFTFIINSSAIKAISFKKNGRSFIVNAVANKQMKIRDKTGKTKTIKLTENSECASPAKPSAKTFKLVSEGALPKIAIINGAKIKAFAWDEDKKNVFFVDAGSQDDVKSITVKDNGNELSYHAVAQGEFKVIPTEEKLFIKKGGSREFTIQGGTPPYHVTSDKPWLTGDMNKTTENTFTSKDNFKVGESAVLTFEDEGGRKKKVQVYVTEDGTEPDFESDRFLINIGVAFLNPYIINTTTDGSGNTVHKLEVNGEPDSNYYLELVYKDRNAWLIDPNSKDSYLDFEARIAYGFEQSEEGNTITGASFGDLSLGLSLIQNKIEEEPSLLERLKDFKGTRWLRKKTNNVNPLAQRFTLNFEGIYGFATDQQNMTMHRYYGYGLVFVYGLPLKDKNYRIVEAIFGGYKGKADVPVLDEDNRNFVKDDNGKPEFDELDTWILRADFRIPVGQKSYLSLGGRYFFIDEENSIEPWSVTASLSVRLDKWIDSLFRAIKE